MVTKRLTGIDVGDGGNASSTSSGWDDVSLKNFQKPTNYNFQHGPNKFLSRIYSLEFHRNETLPVRLLWTTRTLVKHTSIREKSRKVGRLRNHSTVNARALNTTDKIAKRTRHVRWTKINWCYSGGCCCNQWGCGRHSQSKREKDELYMYVCVCVCMCEHFASTDGWKKD